jgi:BlaI family transcriptional regulator, penicillinase repressor
MTALRRLSRFELQIMQALWTSGPLSIREIQQFFPANDQPAYTTVQTMVYRLEAKGAVQRVKKISNAHIFGPLITRESALRRLVDEFLGMFGGRAQPLMTHLIETGKLSLNDIQEAEQTLRRLGKKKENS